MPAGASVVLFVVSLASVTRSSHVSRSSSRGGIVLLGPRRHLALRGGAGEDRAPEPLHSVEQRSRDAFAIECLKAFGTDEDARANQRAVDAVHWLERDDPRDPFVPVTDDVKQKFDDAVLLFDAEMRAEGNFNWRQELAESIRRGISVAEEGGEHGVEEVGTGLDGQTEGEEARGVSKEEEDAWRHRLGLRPREEKEGLSEEEQAEANASREQTQRLLENIPGSDEDEADGVDAIDHSRGYEGPNPPPRATHAAAEDGEFGDAAPTSKLMQAAGQGDLARMAQMIKDARRVEGGQAGAANSINHADEEMDGWTALHLAALRGKVGAIKLLAAAGADLNKASHSKQTPLHLAALEGRRATTAALLHLGADAGVPDAGGCSPLHLAAAGGHVEVCDLLLRGGANPLALNALGESAAAVALQRGHGAVQALVEAWQGSGEHGPEEGQKGSESTEVIEISTGNE